MVLRDFRKLKVSQRSHRLVLAVYNATGTFPREETYGLTAELRRCCASIPANIAEGCGRTGEAELGRFMLIAMGSTSELEYHLLLARDLGYLHAQVYQNRSHEAGEVIRMLSTLTIRVRPPTTSRQAVCKTACQARTLRARFIPPGRQTAFPRPLPNVEYERVFPRSCTPTKAMTTSAAGGNCIAGASRRAYRDGQ